MSREQRPIRRVFVSSTWIDNEDRRKIVEDAILRAGMCPVGMERFTAGGPDTVELPRRRAELYDECVNVLLERWRKAKKLGVSFEASSARRVLQPVAAWLHGEEGRQVATSEELVPSVGPALERVGWKKDVTAEEFLRSIRDESGLLTGWSTDSYGFMHLGFQEYLTARDILSRVLDEDDRTVSDLASHFGESWWREVGLLLLALPDASVFRRYLGAVVDQPAFARHPALVDSCLLDAVEASPDPFVRLLMRDPGEDTELWGRQLEALRVLRARFPSALMDEDLEQTLLAHPMLEISGRAAEAAPVGRTIDAPRGDSELVLVPGGAFLMGSPEDEKGRSDAEGPLHEVTVPSFLLARRPVTNGEYAAYLSEDARAREPKYWADRRYNQPTQPVVGVSWDDARAYCEWAGLRLPSEAEWEYACRAGTRSRYWSGDLEGDLARVGWFRGNSGGRLHAVGEKPANAFGLFDMHGNVWEWCEDGWHGSYEGAPADGAAWVEGARYRAVRGGCFFITAGLARSAFRGWYLPQVRWDYGGFRPARSS